MPKTLNISVVTVFFVLGLFSFGFSEDITITTYYPSPYGSYVEIRANQMSVGSGYIGAALANGNLFVEGNVGIGTNDSAGLKMRVLGTVGVWSGGNAIAVAGYGGVSGVGFSGIASGVGGVGVYGGSTDVNAYAGVFEGGRGVRINGDLEVTGIIIGPGGVVYINPDYVFEPEYNLRSLEELKKFIRENKHLPNMPSTQEINRDGVKIFEQNRLMLEKLEEAYLYIIDLENRITKLEAKLGSEAKDIQVK